MLAGTAHAQNTDSLRIIIFSNANDTIRAGAAIDLAEVMESHNTDSTIFYNQMACRLAVKSGDLLATGEAVRHLAWAYFIASENAKALKLLEALQPLVRFLNRNEKHPYRINRVGRLETVIWGNTASIHLTRSDYQKALTYYLKALAVTERLKNTDYRSVVLGNLGLLYENMGDFNKAREYHEQSLALSRQTGNLSQQSNSLNNLGMLFFQTNENLKAISYFTEAIQIDSSMNNKRGWSSGLGNIGLAYSYLGEAALERCKCNNDSGYFERALYYDMATLKLLREIGFKRHEAVILGNIGYLYLDLRKYDLSEEYLRQSLKLSSEINSLDDVREAHENLAEVFEQRGQHQKALEHYKLFIQYRDSLLNEENTKKTVQLEMQYEFDKKEAAAKLEQEKKNAVAEADKKRQRVILLAISGFGLLVLGFAIFAYRSFLQKKKANVEITRQKELIEEKQKEILDSIFYARRIQRALMPHEKYIARRLKLLNKT